MRRKPFRDAKLPGTKAEHERALAVENYERTVYPLPPPDPTEAIQFRMEQEGLK